MRGLLSFESRSRIKISREFIAHRLSRVSSAAREMTPTQDEKIRSKRNRSAPDGTKRRLDVHVHRVVPSPLSMRASGGTSVRYRDGKITNASEKQRGGGIQKRLYACNHTVTHRSSGGEERKTSLVDLRRAAKSQGINYRIKAQYTILEPATQVPHDAVATAM